ncbi:hypothetical protein OE749_17380 [Aestuariibacter sp. AA17]|uniref:Uncharacterized protein n=1 Tax=Fluctibacter corallii TaxID=2984329 RepID=A0ABT3AE09_9ALTE|nr:hypothetical protein [Aestuariibacter sp. AA17]MCV2886471.1 hypothetical protein [Aestuariibacter sp. AA17]
MQNANLTANKVILKGIFISLFIFCLLLFIFSWFGVSALLAIPASLCLTLPILFLARILKAFNRKRKLRDFLSITIFDKVDTPLIEVNPDEWFKGLLLFRDVKDVCFIQLDEVYLRIKLPATYPSKTILLHKDKIADIKYPSISSNLHEFATLHLRNNSIGLLSIPWNSELNEKFYS